MFRASQFRLALHPPPSECGGSRPPVGMFMALITDPNGAAEDGG